MDNARSAYACAVSRPAAIALVLALFALTASACGGGAYGDDPASLVPAGAALYAEATVRPDGIRAAGALAAARKLLRASDAAGKLRQLFDERLSKSFPGATWKRDFAPWVGQRVGVWSAGLEQASPSFAVIVASRDHDAAKAALARLGRAAGRHTTRQSYAGVGYSLTDDSIAVGQIGDFVVIGTRDAFERTAKERDREHLGDVDRYRVAVAGLDRSRIGLYYIDTEQLLRAALELDPSATQDVRQFDALLGLRRMGPVAGALMADGRGLTLDNVVGHLMDTPLGKLAASWWRGDPALMPDLPRDAWGTFTLPNLGRSTKTVIDSFARTLTGAVLATEARREVRLDPRTVLSWTGDIGAFVRGAPASAGAVLIDATDPARAAAAVRKLVTALREQGRNAGQRVRVPGAETAFTLASDSGTPAIVARSGHRVVVAYGIAAATEALRPRASLGADPRYRQARAALGGGMSPMLLLSNPETVRFLDQLGISRRLRSYLKTFSIATIGGKAEGHGVRLRIAATFHG